MIGGIADTTLVIHLYRRYPPALAWFSQQAELLYVSPITHLEVIYGAGSHAKQVACKKILALFELIPLRAEDQIWAMQQMEKYRLSHGLTVNDCLIASLAHRLQIPLYTHNLKDMRVMIGSLAVQPYL
jgi:hypothetical protein